MTDEIENPMYGDGDELPASVQLDMWIESVFGFTPVHPTRWTQTVRVSAKYL